MAGSRAYSCPLGHRPHSMHCKRAVNLCGREDQEGPRECAHEDCPERPIVESYLEKKRRSWVPQDIAVEAASG